MKIENLDIVKELIAGAENVQTEFKKLPDSWNVVWKPFAPSLTAWVERYCSV